MARSEHVHAQMGNAQSGMGLGGQRQDRITLRYPGRAVLVLGILHIYTFGIPV